MAESELAFYKKEKRRENRSKVRQALFVSEYVFYKQFEIYQEAAKLYNEINQLYSRKPDLRKTEEFRVWRNSITGKPSITVRKAAMKRQPYVFPAHSNIPVAEYVDPGDTFTVVVQPETQQPESPRPESPQPETQQPESPRPESPQPESPQPERPRPESPQPERPRPESPQPIKVMELKIQLLKPPAEVLQEDTTLEPAVYTQTLTLETVTEEVLQEDTALEPSLHEEISPEIIENIINQLRQDPGLKDIMTSVEEQLELEQVGMEVDIPDEDDRLEAELEDMIFW